MNITSHILSIISLILISSMSYAEEHTNNISIYKNGIIGSTYMVQDNQHNFDNFSFTGNSSYGISYLKQIDDFYLGVSFNKVNMKHNYSEIKEKESIYVNDKQTYSSSLLFRYNFMKFNKTRFVLGLDFGGQQNIININNNKTEKEIQEVTASYSIPSETVFPDTNPSSISQKCNGGVEGKENIHYIPSTNTIYTSGNVTCKVISQNEIDVNKSYYDKKIGYSAIMGFNIGFFHEINSNIELGLNWNLITTTDISIGNNHRLNSNTTISNSTIQYVLNIKL